MKKLRNLAMSFQKGGQKQPGLIYLFAGQISLQGKGPGRRDYRQRAGGVSGSPDRAKPTYTDVPR